MIKAITRLLLIYRGWWGCRKIGITVNYFSVKDVSQRSTIFSEISIILQLLYGEAAVHEFKKVCGTHKPILPQIPEEGTLIEFDGWERCRPFVVYADFEALLEKYTEYKEANTSFSHIHRPKSYGVYVKPADYVPLDLSEKYEISTTPIVFRNSQTSVNDFSKTC